MLRTNLSKAVFPHFFVLSIRQELLKKEINIRQENLSWLESRLVELSEVSLEFEIQKQQTALAKLSDDLQTLFSSLCQVFRMQVKRQGRTCLQLSRQFFSSASAIF